MGAFLDKPKTEKYNEGSEGAGLRYGLSSMQGWRIEMEDAHSAVIGLPESGMDHVAWFAVFDGHAGSRVSAHCARHLLDCILAADDFKDALRVEKKLTQEQLFGRLTTAILQGFLELDEKLRKIPEVANGEDKSGTTAVCALITEQYVILSNCGDSRGVMSRGGQPVMVTQDHKPSNPDERERIQNAGGSVMIQRVNGSLAVSRALGDFEYKNVEGRGPTEQLVSPEPEFYITKRDPADEFLVLACDGVWDVMTNEEIIEFVSHRLKIHRDLETVANEVIDTCLHKGSRDNMSIIVITFPGAPKVCNDAVKKEHELNEEIKNRVADIVKDNKDVDFASVYQKISDESFASPLPKSGGMYSKKNLIEDHFYRLCPDKKEASVSPDLT